MKSVPVFRRVITVGMVNGVLVAAARAISAKCRILRSRPHISVDVTYIGTASDNAKRNPTVNTLIANAGGMVW